MPRYDIREYRYKGKVASWLPGNEAFTVMLWSAYTKATIMRLVLMMKITVICDVVGMLTHRGTHNEDPVITPYPFAPAL